MSIFCNQFWIVFCTERERERERDVARNISRLHAMHRDARLRSWFPRSHPPTFVGGKVPPRLLFCQTKTVPRPPAEYRLTTNECPDDGVSARPLLRRLHLLPQVARTQVSVVERKYWTTHWDLLLRDESLDEESGPKRVITDTKLRAVACPHCSGRGPRLDFGYQQKFQRNLKDWCFNCKKIEKAKSCR